MGGGGLLDFRDVDTLAGAVVGAPVTTSDSSTSWAAFASWWQYLFALEDADRTIDVTDGRPDLEGIGVFARFGLADTKTNPVDWYASVGFGGRGVVPGRPKDTWGIAYAYNDIQDVLNVAGGLLDRQTEVFEVYYDLAIAGSVNLTTDFQWISGAFTNVDPSFVVDFPLNIRF